MRWCWDSSSNVLQHIQVASKMNETIKQWYFKKKHDGGFSGWTNTTVFEIPTFMALDIPWSAVVFHNSWGHHRGDLVISPISMDPLLKWKVFPAENHWGPNWKNLFGLPHIDDDLGLESRPPLQQQHVCKIHHLHICVIVSSILIVLSHSLATFLLISVFPNQCFLKSIVDKIWENHRKSPGMLVACPPLLQWVQFPFAPVLLGHSNFACFTQGTQLQENVNGPTDSKISTRWMGTFRGWSYLSTLWLFNIAMEAMAHRNR